MTLEDKIAELKTLRAAAEPGPFEYNYCEMCLCPHGLFRVNHGNRQEYLFHHNEQHQLNGKYVAAALNLSSVLIERIEQLEAELKSDVDEN